MQTGTFGPDSAIIDLNWHSLCRFKEAFFSKSVYFKAQVQRYNGSGDKAKKQKVECSRLVWPCVMVSAVGSVKEGAHEHFDASLPVLSSGRMVLWAWYLALYEALDARDPRLNCLRPKHLPRTSRGLTGSGRPALQ